MAGHSKFKNIMHRKGAQDKKRAKLFSKLGREISVAAKLGGEDPEMNPRLRLAIQNAKANSMPKDNIERAIKTGIGSGDDQNFEEMRYEGYGPGGIAIIVDALTDNRNRTASEVRSSFSKLGGNLGESGSVSFMFERVGEIIYPIDKADFETVFEAAVEAGAQNCEDLGDVYEIICDPDDFAEVTSKLESKLGEPERAQLGWKANTLSPVDEEQAQTIIKLIELLEDSDDVQNVTTNMNISDELMEKLTG